uniref:Tail protein n=1 Tax=viral metagenome TaxID=1070528 RepID=A0A6M3IST8_9ZZZZ
MSAKVWDERNYVIDKQYWSGTKTMHGLIKNAAAVDNGDGTVQIPMDAHGMSALNMVIIAGTTNYNGIHLIPSVSTNYINITATYVAENFGGSETWKTAFQIVPTLDDYQVMEARLTLSAAGGTSENFTITLDSAEGAAWDCTLETQDMNAVAFDDVIWGINERRFFDGDDVLLFQYANSNSRTWGLELIYRRHA